MPTARSSQYASTADFVVGHPWALDTGRQIDWANVSSAYLNAATGKKIIPAGTVMGEKINLDAGGTGKMSPRVAVTNPGFGLLQSTAVEGDPSAAETGYGVLRGAQIFEALLPDASGTPRTLASDIKDELAAAGPGFGWSVFQDNRS